MGATKKDFDSCVAIHPVSSYSSADHATGKMLTLGMIDERRGVGDDEIDQSPACTIKSRLADIECDIASPNKCVLVRI